MYNILLIERDIHMNNDIPNFFSDLNVNSIEEAISQGKADYKDLPDIFDCENHAIKIRVIQFIFAQFNGVDFFNHPVAVIDALARMK